MSTTQTQLDQWNECYSLPGLKFDFGKGGLARAVIDTHVAAGELYLHGSHVTRWQPVGYGPVLWMSDASQFEAGKPIRGGIPICFPWFGPHPSDAGLPAHGMARTQPWDLQSSRSTAGGGIGLQLSTEIAGFALDFVATFDRQLKLSLTVCRGEATAGSSEFEVALHTYLAVGDVRSIDIQGLEKSAYIDKMDQARVKPPSGSAIVFDRETDRVYFDTTSTCSLRDKQLHRMIRVEKVGSHSTVVWNPWIDKSARMLDFGNDEWPGMVCIETANVGSNKIQLQPGQAHETQVCLSVEPLG